MPKSTLRDAHLVGAEQTPQRREPGRPAKQRNARSRSQVRSKRSLLGGDPPAGGPGKEAAQ
eukprot:1195003-Prorocentrum_minimum.AAC.7